MSSPITMSGFNNIDWNSVLNALMQQESIPLTALQSQQSVITAQQTAFSTFASKLGTLESAVEDLQDANSFNGRAVTSSNSGAVSATVGNNTPIGTYEVLVTELARAQVTGTTDTHADADTTIVASGGSLVIGGKTVNVTTGVTLQGLADAINGTTGIGVTASVVKNGTNYQLALTGNKTGAANAFTITNSLTGGTNVAFSATNAQDAKDAAGTVNGIAFTSDTNQVTGALPGATLNLVHKDALNTIVLTITGDSTTVKSMVTKFASAYNDVVKFIDAQQAAFGRKETNNIGSDPLIRGLRSQLSQSLVRDFGTGTFSVASQAGLELQRDGTLTFNSAAFDDAVTKDPASVQNLFTSGVFKSLLTSVQSYTKSDGLVPNAQQRLDDASSRMADRIDDMNNQLALKRAALQAEMIAADQAIASLNQQANSLSSLGSQYKLF